MHVLCATCGPPVEEELRRGMTTTCHVTGTPQSCAGTANEQSGQLQPVPHTILSVHLAFCSVVASPLWPVSVWDLGIADLLCWQQNEAEVPEKLSS